MSTTFKCAACGKEQQGPKKEDWLLPLPAPAPPSWQSCHFWTQDKQTGATWSVEFWFCSSACFGGKQPVNERVENFGKELDRLAEETRRRW